MPLWRDYSGDPPEPVTRPGLAKGHDAIERLIEAAGQDSARWTSLLGHWAHFAAPWREQAASGSLRHLHILMNLPGLRFASSWVGRSTGMNRSVMIMDEHSLAPMRRVFDALGPTDVTAR